MLGNSEPIFMPFLGLAQWKIDGAYLYSSAIEKSTDLFVDIIKLKVSAIMVVKVRCSR